MALEEELADDLLVHGLEVKDRQHFCSSKQLPLPCRLELGDMPEVLKKARRILHHHELDVDKDSS